MKVKTVFDKIYLLQVSVSIFTFEKLTSNLVKT